MTWIKPSFLWMMYRCGWGAKEGQESVLVVEITCTGDLDAARTLLPPEHPYPTPDTLLAHLRT
jgi:hypothetical protein